MGHLNRTAFLHSDIEIEFHVDLLNKHIEEINTQLRRNTLKLMTVKRFLLLFIQDVKQLYISYILLVGLDTNTCVNEKLQYLQLC